MQKGPDLSLANLSAICKHFKQHTHSESTTFMNTPHLKLNKNRRLHDKQVKIITIARAVGCRTVTKRSRVGVPFSTHQKLFWELGDIWPSYFFFQIANNKGAEQTARMHRLVCAFVVCKQQSQDFSRRGPYDVEAHASWPPPGYMPGVQEQDTSP